MPKRELRYYDRDHDSQIYLGECRNQQTGEIEIEAWTERVGHGSKRALMGPSVVLTMAQAEAIAEFITSLK